MAELVLGVAGAEGGSQRGPRGFGALPCAVARGGCCALVPHFLVGNSDGEDIIKDCAIPD